MTVAVVSCKLSAQCSMRLWETLHLKTPASRWSGSQVLHIGGAPSALHCDMACGQVWGCNAVAHRLDAPSTSASGARRRSRDRTRRCVKSWFLSLRALLHPTARRPQAQHLRRACRSVRPRHPPPAQPGGPAVASTGGDPVRRVRSLALSSRWNITKHCAEDSCLQLQRLAVPTWVCMLSTAVSLPILHSSMDPSLPLCLAGGHGIAASARTGVRLRSSSGTRATQGRRRCR